jgi:hypothetical protein
MKKFVVIGCLSILLISCGKSFLDPNGGGEVIPPPDLVLKKIMQAGKLDTEYEYNSSGQFVKSTVYYSSGGIYFERVIRYDNAGLITKIETSRETTGSSNPKYEQAYSELFYSSQKLTETKNYRIESGASVYTGRTVPEYNSDGRTIAVIEYDASGQVKGKTTYDYHEGNAVKIYNYLGNSSTPVGDTGYEFDNLKNPLKGISTFPFSANVNNITKTVLGATQVSATYTYNSRGYPTSKTENGISFEYIYQ